MDATLTPTTRPGLPALIGGLGLLWNAYGVVQFAGAVTATEESLIATGLTGEQAAVMAHLPLWMTLAFAIGVFGGLAGSALLMLRRALALPVLVASLAAYVVLYIGDIAKGVFAVMGAPQVIILTVVVAIAAGLVAATRHFARRGALV